MRRRAAIFSRVFLAALSVGIILATTPPTLDASRGEPRTEEAARPLGPAPINDQGRFMNPVGVLRHGTTGTRLPFMLRRIGGLFRNRPGAPPPIAFAAERLRELTEQSATSITWIGHSTMLVRMAGVTFLTDPTWSGTASPLPNVGPRRFVLPGIDFDELPRIDFVVVSHNHYDHLDLGTLRRLAERDPATRFFVPLGNAALLRENGIERVREFDWGDSLRVASAVVYCLPAQHWSKRSLTDDQKTLWSSWAVLSSEKRFFFAGDTGYFGGFRKIADRLGPFDLVSMPIGAYAPREMMRSSHLNPEESVQAAIDLEARAAVAMHFGTFDLSDEPLPEPPARFKAAAEASRLGGTTDGDAAWVLDIGETRLF